MRHKYGDKSLDAPFSRKITDKTTEILGARILVWKKKLYLEKLKKKGIEFREVLSIIVDREIGK